MIENNITTIGERIRNIYETEGISQTKFAEKIGIRQSTISGIMQREEKGGKSSTTDEVLAAIMRAYPTLNPKWLVLGEGEKFV